MSKSKRIKPKKSNCKNCFDYRLPYPLDFSPLGCLQGFAKGSKVLKAPPSHKMIALPAGFIPKHTFNDEQQAPGKRNDESGTDQQQQQQQQKRLSSKERSLMFGETVKTLDDVNKWALKWDKPVEEGGKEGGKEDADKNDKEDNEEKQKTSRYEISFWISVVKWYF